MARTVRQKMRRVSARRMATFASVERRDRNVEWWLGLLSGDVNGGFEEDGVCEAEDVVITSTTVDVIVVERLGTRTLPRIVEVIIICGVLVREVV
jgi:hypothetical protein